MKSNLTADFISYPFLEKHIPSHSKSKRIAFGSLRGQKPTIFAASSTHYLFLNEIHQLYGFGSNSHSQITASKSVKLIAVPVLIDSFSNVEIREIACGENFSAVLTNRQEVTIFGVCKKQVLQKPIIRGLSASGDKYAFAYSVNNVYIGYAGPEEDKGHSKSRQYELPEPILKTEISDSFIAVLDQNGIVYILLINLRKKNDTFVKLEKIDHKVLDISAAHDSLTMLCEHCIYVYSDGDVSVHFLPRHFKAIFATSSFGDLFALSDNGKVGHTKVDYLNSEIMPYSMDFKSLVSMKNNNNVYYNDINKSRMNQNYNDVTKQHNSSFLDFDAISYISARGNSVVFIKSDPLYGNPYEFEYVPKVVPIKSGSKINSDAINDVFICCTTRFAYFNELILPFSCVPSILARKHVEGAHYFTMAQNPVELVDPSIGNKVLVSLNMSIGDIIKLNKTNGPSFEIVGTDRDNNVWARPTSSGFVVALPFTSSQYSSSTISSLLNSEQLLANRHIEDAIELIERKGHVIQKMWIGGREVSVDITPSTCELLGYSIGDLIWHQEHGIVEIVGIYCGNIVLLDFEERLLFLQEPFQFKMLRKSNNKSTENNYKNKDENDNNKFGYFREVVCNNGEAVSIDVSWNNKRIFLPTDRVLSSIGEATVLGYNKVPYIQTDEMRMNGYEAIAANVLDLTLLRRINGVAKRKVKLDNDEVIEVSLNTEDTIRGLLPGDKVRVLNKIFNVVGFSNDQVIVQPQTKQQNSKQDQKLLRRKNDRKEGCQILGQSFELIYRSDINGKRASITIPTVGIGSPMIQESCYLPGDIVFNDQLGECEFLGFAGSHVLFISRNNCEIFTLSYSILFLDDFFDIHERPALDLWEDDKQE